MQKNWDQFDKYGHRCHGNKKRGEGIFYFFILHPKSMKLYRIIAYYE